MNIKAIIILSIFCIAGLLPIATADPVTTAPPCASLECELLKTKKIAETWNFLKDGRSFFYLGVMLIIIFILSFYCVIYSLAVFTLNQEAQIPPTDVEEEGWIEIKTHYLKNITHLKLFVIELISVLMYSKNWHENKKV